MDADQLTPELAKDAPRHSMQRLVRHLDLFSGIGGFALAAQMAGGIETVAFCEIEEYPQRILAKNFPNVPIHGDIKTLDPQRYGQIDLITGGFPCQPYSTAGRRKGGTDSRVLWPEMRRVIEGCKPRWVLGENVTGLKSMGLDTILDEMENLGYSCQTLNLPASSVGASHRRARLWIVAYADSLGQPREGLPLCISGAQETDRKKHLSSNGGSRTQWSWPVEPSVGRVANGIPDRVDRLHGLGNAIVPQVAAEILRCMMAVNSLLPNSLAQERPAFPAAECSKSTHC